MVPLLEPAKGLIENSAFPVNYLSYSAIREYLKCPRSFLMKYVRHEFSFSTSKAMLIGSIAHRVIEMAIKQEQDYTKNMASLYEVLLATVAIWCRTKWLIFLAFSEKFIKTLDPSVSCVVDFTNPPEDTTTDSALKEYTLVAKEKYPQFFTDDQKDIITLYLEDIEPAVSRSLLALCEILPCKLSQEITGSDLPSQKVSLIKADVYYPIVHSEISGTYSFTHGGQVSPLPIKAVVDAIALPEVTLSGDCVLIDWKCVSRFGEDAGLDENGDSTTPLYDIQAAACYFMICGMIDAGHLDIPKPTKMLFVELLTKQGKLRDKITGKTDHLKEELIDLYPAEYDRVVLKKKKKEELQEELKNLGILEEKLWKITEVDFTTHDYILDDFFNIFTSIVNHIGYDEVAGYLPNVGDMMDGTRAYNDFRAFEVIPDEVKSDKIDQVVEQKKDGIKKENTLSESQKPKRKLIDLDIF